jgi:hypothetical protein
MQNFSASPREMAASLWRNKDLIRNLIHREVVGRYKGAMLGITLLQGLTPQLSAKAQAGSALAQADVFA